jgi:pyrroline-5-carboxylate reductase
VRYELGIIGAGNMAEAIARGILRGRVLRAEQMIASDVSAPRRKLFQKELGIRATENNAEAAGDSRAILLSVKPQQMEQVLKSIGPGMTPETLVISIAAGISSAFIEKHLGEGRKWRVIRTMPNTPMLVGEGVVAMSRGQHAQTQDVATARRIFEAAAVVLEVGEEKMDAVTAISGSGPAYFFYLVEHMIRAGVELGLTDEQAHTLAARTALGAAKMLTASSDSPRQLRRKVTSPGGTTQAAIQTMGAAKVGQGIVAALHRAAQRSRELGG